MLDSCRSAVAICMLMAANIGWTGQSAGTSQSRAGAQNQTKFTAPPGQETDAVTKLIDSAVAALRAGKSVSDILTDPAFLPAHEWPRFRKLIRESANSSHATIVTPNEPGEPLAVSARVVDREDRPLAGALVYVYQTSLKGWYSDRAAHYSANEGDRKFARLFGYLITDSRGAFTLRTIRPAGYPDSDLPAHIHVEIMSPNQPAIGVATEIRFDDDPRLTADWRKRSQQEGFVITKVRKESDEVQRVQVEFKLR